ncbi:MAG: hypothetical protein ACOYXT_02695, partial [Bacteroidota bacterium]
LITMVLSACSCAEDVADCPSKMCVVAGGWKLTEVYLDDVRDPGDLSQYQLVLRMPSPATEVFSDFNRVQASGVTDEGIWSLENNGEVLRLIPNNDPLFTEDWIIESFSPRVLILVLNRDAGIKQGPGKVRFVLEPI